MVLLPVYGDVDYKLFQPVIASIKEIIIRVFHQTTDFFKQHPYAKVTATVRQSFDLCNDEIKCVSIVP